MQYLIYIILFTEFLAALFATIYFSKYKNTSLKWILILLWYIPVNEFFCQFILEVGDEYIFYNFYRLITCFGLLWITKNELVSTRRKKYINILIVLCALAFIINFSFVNPFNQYVEVAFTLSTLLIVLGLLLYLVELLSSDQVIEVSRDLFLWISCGFLIFHISYPILSLARRFLVNGSIRVDNSMLYIQFIAIVLCYIVIAFGFFRGNKRSKNINH